MTNNQENSLAMMIAFLKFLSQKSDYYSKLPEFENNLTILKGKVAQIEDLAPLHRANQDGAAKDKVKMRKSLLVSTLSYKTSLYAFAILTKNSTLFNKVDITNKVLRAANETALKDFATILHTEASPYIDAMKVGNYNVSAEEHEAFGNLIKAYGDIMPNVRLSSTEYSALTKRIKEHFMVCKEVLKHMDLSAALLATKEPIFYADYKKVRKVINKKAKSTLSVQGIILDQTSGEPVKGVEIAFIKTEEAQKEMKLASVQQLVPDFKKKSAKKGRFYIKSLGEGTYILRLRKLGFVEQTFTIYVLNGEKTIVNAALSKVA